MSEQVRIRGIAAGGDGVGILADGRAVFVPRTAPGELVELSDATPGRRYARARLAAVLEPSPDRVAPRCPHYDGDRCGGCQLQHLASPAQREARRRIVVEALRRIGGVDAELSQVEAAASDWEYRAKLTLAARGPRLGYHRFASPEVFDLGTCHLARPELDRLWQALRPHRRLLPLRLEQLVLRVDRSGQAHLLARGGDQAWTRGKDLGRALAAEAGEVMIWWEPTGGAARTVSGARESYPVTVFEQVHPVMGDRVRAWAVEALGEVEGRMVWDLYAGIGETTAALAALGARVESVEIDRRAVAVAASRAHVGEVRRHQGRVEDLVGRLPAPDLVIANPPRAGMAVEVIDRLGAGPPVRLVYVSCDPATLARDVARLAPTFRVALVRAFDVFPQTAHVETVVSFERR